MVKAPSDRAGRFVAALVVMFAVSLPLVTVRIYAADELQIYALLRSVWKDGDLDCRNEYVRLLEGRPWETGERTMLVEPTTPTGAAPNFAPVGTALLWSPFFALGELGARLTGAATDGYSYPYFAAVCYGSALYAFLGLLLLFDVARREIPTGAAFAGVVVAWWATALPFYMYATPPMSHGTSFFTTALFVWLWVRWRSQPTVARSLGLGVAAGLAAIVREQNALLMILAAIDLCAMARPRSGGLVAAAGHAAAIAIGVCLMLVPQLLAWHAWWGRFKPAEQRMSFFVPWLAHLFDVVASSDHGLLTWHPVWIPSILGLIALARARSSVALPLLVAFLVQLAFLGSVSNWAGGMAFGQRRLLDCLFVVVLGSGFLCARLPRSWTTAVAALLVVWNLSFMVQFGSKMIPREGPVDWTVVLRNQVVVMPRRIWDLAARYLVDRQQFFAHPAAGSPAVER